MTLHEAAAAAGLQPDWHDATGRPHRVADATLAAILERLTPWEGDTNFISALADQPISLPPAFPIGPAILTLEDGTRQHLTLDGQTPPISRIGYHHLACADHHLTLAIAPPRCPGLPPGRLWAPAVQIPALQALETTAFGDLGTLAGTAKAFAQAGADAIAISPTHALFPTDPTRFSPYSPSTRLFHNVLLADPALAGDPPLNEPASALIDWHAAIPARLHHLRLVFENTSQLTRDAATTFRRQQGETLEAHARFDALHAHFGGNGWPDWPTDYHDPVSPAVARFATDHATEVDFYAFLQWLADTSLAAAQPAARTAGMRIGLIADLAVGMDPGGSHGWSRRDDLLTGLSIGAPPDPLGPDGQQWGITALAPAALHRTGFASFIATLRTALAHAGAIRIDHALGLQRLWVIPDGAPADQGAYLTMPFAHLANIVAIEAHRADAVVIAEDLGTVPPGFRDTLAARAMLGMRVLPFERGDDGGFTPPHRWDANAVAMTGTHDTPTVAGWWRGRDIDWSWQLGRASAGEDEAADRDHRAGERDALWDAARAAWLADGPTPPADDPAPAVDAALRFVAATPCPLAILPIEDLLGLEEQPNLPGTIDEHPNWRRRLPDDTAALLARPEVAARLAMLTAARTR